MAALSDEELCRVGVTTIGDRLRLRDLCAVAEKDRTRESVASNVLQERMALFNGRNSRRADRKKKAVAKRSWTVSFVCVADRHQSSSSDNAATFAGSIRSAKKWGIRDSKCNSFKMSSMIFFRKAKRQNIRKVCYTKYLVEQTG